MDRSLAEMMASLAAMHKKLTMTTKSIDRDPPLLYDTVDYEILIKYAERIAKFSRGPSKIDPSIALSSLPNLPWPTVRISLLSTGLIISLLSNDDISY